MPFELKWSEKELQSEYISSSFFIYKHRQRTNKLTLTHTHKQNEKNSFYLIKLAKSTPYGNV